VVLGGQVFHPELRDDAEIAVAGIPGMCEIVNHITFLPDSPADNRVRLAVFTAIYAQPSMSIYATVGSGGAIHVVVQGGKVALEGEVGSKVDARRAADLARAQPGVIVTNH
jgi:osmotically-inducible protein OsmY